MKQKRRRKSFSSRGLLFCQRERTREKSRKRFFFPSIMYARLSSSLSLARARFSFFLYGWRSAAKSIKVYSALGPWQASHPMKGSTINNRRRIKNERTCKRQTQQYNNISKWLELDIKRLLVYTFQEQKIQGEGKEESSVSSPSPTRRKNPFSEDRASLILPNGLSLFPVKHKNRLDLLLSKWNNLMVSAGIDVGELNLFCSELLFTCVARLVCVYI